MQHPCTHNNGGCDHLCLVAYETFWDAKVYRNLTKGVARCACEEGYRIVDDRRCLEATKELVFSNRQGRLELKMTQRFGQTDEKENLISKLNSYSR